MGRKRFAATLPPPIPQGTVVYDTPHHSVLRLDVCGSEFVACCQLFCLGMNIEMASRRRTNSTALHGTLREIAGEIRSLRSHAAGNRSFLSVRPAVGRKSSNSRGAPRVSASVKLSNCDTLRQREGRGKSKVITPFLGPEWNTISPLACRMGYPPRGAGR